MIGGRWSNTAEAADALEALALMVSREDVVAKAMLTVSRPIAREMEERLYQQITRRTGETGEALEAQRVDAAEGIVAVEIGPRAKSDGGWRVRFWERGTSKLPARPFMRPVWDEHERAFSADVTDVLRDAYRSGRQAVKGRA